MSKLFVMLVGAIMLGAPAPTRAYPVTVAIYDEPGRDHDVIVIDVVNVDRKQLVWFQHDGSTFRIRMIDHSIEMTTPIQPAAGMKGTEATFRSLDRLHDLTLTSGDARYNIRVYLTDDFLWAEVWRSGEPLAAVRSTVFFVGPTHEIYTRMRNAPGRNHFRYAKLGELKNAIQNGYATPYDPRMPRRFLYDRRGWAALTGLVSAQ